MNLVDASEVASTSFGKTTRLAVGLATVMRLPTRAAQLRLLEGAYEVGYRHFDVAPLYGLGAAEGVLGQFLAAHPDATVGTKFGLPPSRIQRILSPIQAPLRELSARSSSARSLARALVGKPSRPTSLTLEMLQQSAARSAELLRREKLDVLLTHEIEWTNEWTSLWKDARNSAIPAQSFGVAGSHQQLSHYPRAVLETSDVIQTRGAPFMQLDGRSTQTQIVYGVLSALQLPGATELTDLTAEAASLMQRTGSTYRSAIAAVLFHNVLVMKTSTIVIVGSTQVQHLREVWDGVADLSTRPVLPSSSVQDLALANAHLVDRASAARLDTRQ